MLTAYVQDRIRVRAYELWIAGGRLEGQADEHWLAAEREVLNETAGEIGSTISAVASRLPRQAQSRAKGVKRRKKIV